MPQETEKFVALDSHAATTSYTIRRAEGKIFGQGTVETCRSQLVWLVKTIPGKVHLTFEEGTQAAWLYDILSPYVAELVVCDPRRNRAVFEGNKSDVLDTEELSELLRVGSLRPVYHGEHGTRELKQLVRAHEEVVRDVVRVKNRIKSMFRSRGVQVGGSAVYTSRRVEYMELLDRAEVKRRLEFQFRELDSLEPLRDQTVKEMLQESRRHRGCRLLKTVPGIGPIRAAKIVGLLDTPHRFRTKRQLWAYAGLAVVTRSSSDYEVTPQGIRRKKWQVTRGLNRNFNRTLKMVFKSAAKDALQHAEWKAYYEQLLDSLEPEIARVTLARKIAAISLAVWKKGEKYDASKIVKCS